jgi:hypothetical protein
MVAPFAFGRAFKAALPFAYTNIGPSSRTVKVQLASACEIAVVFVVVTIALSRYLPIAQAKARAHVRFHPVRNNR